MADFSKPAVTQVYTEAFQDIRENQEELAKMFSGSIPSNTPTGAVRFLNGTFSTYNGSSFVASPIAIAGGGTGATTPSAVRSNFDLLSSAEISAQFVSGQAGTGPGEFRNNGQNDARFVPGQAGTAYIQVQNNGQNRAEFAIISGENNSDFYQETTIGPTGDMTNGSAKIVRVGNLVTICGAFDHSELVSPGTATNSIPDWAVPTTNEITNTYYVNSPDTKVVSVLGGSSKYLSFEYNEPSTGTLGFTISYTV